MNTSDPIRPPFNEVCDEARLRDEIARAQTPQRFVQAGSDGRLIQPLRDAARTHDAKEILIRSSVVFYAARHPGKIKSLPPADDEPLANILAHTPLVGPAQLAILEAQTPADEALATALADLAVTGRHAWNNFRVLSPNESGLAPAVNQRLARLGVTPAPNDVNSATAAALDRAYLVAQALRDPFQPSPARAGLGWISVSGEDDPPHRPVNVAAAPYPQYEIPVGVSGVTVQTRFFIASPASHEHGATPVLGKRSIPQDARPTIPDGNQVILFIHGHSSSAEEAIDIIPSLHEAGQKQGIRFSIVSLDLPCNGYSSMFDHTRVPGLESNKTTFPGGIFDHGPIHTPVLDFIENFIVAFVDALDHLTPIKSRFAGVIGGSLGGNMGLRLGRRDLAQYPWLKSGIVSWDPASVWSPMVQDEVKRHAPEHCQKKWDEPELAASRLNYFKEVFDGETYDEKGNRHQMDEVLTAIVLGHTQPQMWYRDDWGNCKQLHIQQSRVARHEIYHEFFRRWHWRVAGEQLIFSHVDRVDHENSHSPCRYELNHARQLLAAGEKDNYRFSNIYDATRELAGKMKNTPGRTLFLLDTGHSIHAERPRYFAGEIAKFFTSERARPAG